MNIRCNRRYTGFTLSEVLITLVIIGVIAAITVPSVMQTTQRQEFVSALKKAHSVLNQALYRIAIDNGYPLGDYSFFEDENFIDEFGKVVNIMQKCNNTADCFGKSIKSSYKYLNNNLASDAKEGKSVITADGLLYTFSKVGTKYGLSPEDQANTIGRIIVDVNGRKAPNKYGLDTFFFYVVEGKGIVPAGQYSTSTCTRSSHGRSCTAKVLKEGKINY